MLKKALLLAALLIAAMPWGALAQAKDQKPGGTDKSVDLLLQSMVITVDFALPSWKDGPQAWGGKAPELAFIKRGTQPDMSAVHDKFFRNTKATLGTEPISSPAYGKGTRYKGPRLSLDKAGALVGYSFYLDKYTWGFEYVNNMVIAPASTETSDSTPQNRKYNFRFTKEAGVAAAKKFIADLTPGVGDAGTGFDIKEDAWFDHTKGKLFVYRLTKSCNGVPLADDYIQVALDGEKNIANVSYFWSKDVKPYGESYAALDAGISLQIAKSIVLNRFNNEPPPLTLFNAKLAYINYRKDPTILQPVWLFDCRWNETRKYENPGWDAKKGGQRYGSEVITNQYLVAVDALYGLPVEGIPPVRR